MFRSLFILALSFSTLFSVRAQTWSNKEIPLELKSPIEEALSYFPELSSYHVAFKFRKRLKNRVMQAQPKIRTLFNGKAKRHYKITISRELVMKDTTMTITQLPQEVLVGWFAHELGHVMDYKDRSALNLIGFAINYLTSKPFLKKSELRADYLAANNGCAKELIRTKRFILFKSKFTKEYKSKIRDLYPSPEEITAMLEE